MPTNFPNGLMSRGVPVELAALLVTKGNVYHVDSGHANADDDNAGTNPSHPLATGDAAVAKCTANNGDIILVSEGHAETLTTKFTLDVAGVTVIGLGQGDDRPAFTVGAVIDGIDITAADCHVYNLRFPTPTSAATSLINIAAARSGVHGCWIEQGANLVDAITVTADGEEPVIEDNVVLVTADGPDSFVKFEGVVDLPVIRRNIVVGSDGTNAYDDGVIDFNSVAVTNPFVYDNLFDGADVATTVIANAGALVGDHIGRNTYSGTATDGDTIAAILANPAAGGIVAASFGAGAIDAAAIAANAIGASEIADGAIDAGAIATGAIDLDSLAADALQAMQDEAEDALEGENLDHVAAVTTAAADMTAEVVDGSILSRVLSKTSDTSTYDPTTDALEMLSDKAGAFSGDGGAAQDDSVKASLDLAHTDLDAILDDTGTSGVVIGADAITAAKIADNAISEEHIDADAAARMILGIGVDRATEDVTTGVAVPIYTIAGGRVLVTSLVGEVTTQIGAGATNARFQSNPTTGTTTNLCANLDIDADEVGTLYTIAGAPGTAMQTGQSGNVPEMSVKGVVVAVGQIEFITDADRTGSIKFHLRYVPLDTGATVTAV